MLSTTARCSLSTTMGIGRLYARAVGKYTSCTVEPMVAVTGEARGCYMPSTRYLVVSGGRLLMVHRVLRSDATSEFTVSKADLTSSRWVDVPSVGGDTALFVGRWSSVALLVSRYAMPGNRIHFLDDDAFSRHFGGYPFSGYPSSQYGLKAQEDIDPREIMVTNGPMR